MFNYARLIGSARPVGLDLSADDAADSLRGHSIEFLSNDKPVRFPRKGDALLDALRRVEGTHGAAGVARSVHSLVHPDLRVPLTTQDKMTNGQRVVATASVGRSAGQDLLILARLTLVESKSKYEPLSSATIDLDVVDDADDARERLESLYREAPPPARRIITRDSDDAYKVVWIGGIPNGTVMPYEARELLEASGAVRGAEMKFYDEPDRRPKDVLAALRASTPDVVVIWLPQARRCDEIVRFAESHPDATYLAINSEDFDIARLELRLFLDEFATRDEISANPPRAGEERFYRKHRGSKIGDVMMHVQDCGHDDWGPDARQSAPRARKGIEHKEGQVLAHLSLCKGCIPKHRWKGRF
jgi:hypothetical protein